MFGRCWTCPPDIGDIDKLMQDIHNYQYALVYQFVAPIEDSYDFEGMIDAKKEFVRITRGISRYLKEHPKRETLHLGAGGCGICEKCAKQTDEPCRFPDEALPSLEGYGVNVYRLAQSADMKYINGQNTVTYFGAVLFNN